MTKSNVVDNSALAIQVAKLWPHREHESNILLSQFCRVGLHRWRRLDLAALAEGKDVRHCFWCSKVSIDGIAYDS